MPLTVTTREVNVRLMPALPLLRPREVVRAFERLGWRIARQ